jgi:succinate dehydrogenase/fumarate reductase flavoprotein subunit
LTGRLDCDLVVIGGGMAGMTAAARAAGKGARVIVVEKASEIGGSAALSGGYVWTATSLAQMNLHDDGDAEMHAVVIEEYPEVLGWMGERGIDMRPPQQVLYGRGRQIDMQGHLRKAVSEIEGAGGFVVRGTDTLEIVRQNGHVAGIVTAHPDGETELFAPNVLIATGGFQGDAELRARHIHPAAKDMGLRSNTTSIGAGLKLGIAAGGAWAGPNTGYYGHLVATPVPFRTDSDFVKYTQYHSIHGILLNRAGKRFVDESNDDHASSQLTIRQDGASALLIWDARVQESYAVVPPVAGAEPLDRFQLAIDAGARGGKAATLEEIAAIAERLGFDGAACVAGLTDYNHLMKTAPERAQPLREAWYQPLDRAPFYVLEVVSAITFTFGGLLTDAKARVLDPFGEPIGGLYVAGADVGNVFRCGYSGGLALAATFAFRAMRTAGF